MGGRGHAAMSSRHQGLPEGGDRWCAGAESFGKLPGWALEQQACPSLSARTASTRRFWGSRRCEEGQRQKARRSSLLRGGRGRARRSAELADGGRLGAESRPRPGGANRGSSPFGTPRPGEGRGGRGCEGRRDAKQGFAVWGPRSPGGDRSDLGLAVAGTRAPHAGLDCAPSCARSNGRRTGAPSQRLGQPPPLRSHHFRPEPSRSSLPPEGQTAGSPADSGIRAGAIRPRDEAWASDAANRVGGERRRWRAGDPSRIKARGRAT